MSELTRHSAYRGPFVISGSPFTIREVRAAPSPRPGIGTNGLRPASCMKSERIADPPSG